VTLPFSKAAMLARFSECDTPRSSACTISSFVFFGYPNLSWIVVWAAALNEIKMEKISSSRKFFMTWQFKIESNPKLCPDDPIIRLI